MTPDYRSLSLWHDTVPGALAPRPSLDAAEEADVAIVGAGLTGLWTAWYLLERDPTLRVVLLEKEIAGFGASGRNGGWCSALFPRSTASLERAHGRDAAIAMRRAMIATVDEVGRASAEAGIDCHFVKGGTTAFARSGPQLTVARAEVGEAARFGVDPLELRESQRCSTRTAPECTRHGSCADWLRPSRRAVRGSSSAPRRPDGPRGASRRCGAMSRPVP